MAIARQTPRQPADILDEDFLELTGRYPLRQRGGGPSRKTLQLCSQIADTLNYVLGGDCDDELLQNLQVASVVPAPNASQLLVTVYPVVESSEPFNAEEVRRQLSDAAGRLRAEIARSITRKNVPNLLFQVVQLI